jgi:hypothetical protein
MKMQFKEWNCDVSFSYYQNNNRTAIILTDHNTHEPIAVATVNIPEAPLEDDQVIIKDYSENEGMKDALILAGIIKEEMVSEIQTGFVTCPVYELTELAKEIRACS